MIVNGTGKMVHKLVEMLWFHFDEISHLFPWEVVLCLPFPLAGAPWSTLNDKLISIQENELFLLLNSYFFAKAPALSYVRLFNYHDDFPIALERREEKGSQLDLSCEVFLLSDSVARESIILTLVDSDCSAHFCPAWVLDESIKYQTQRSWEHTKFQW